MYFCGPSTADEKARRGSSGFAHPKCHPSNVSFRSRVEIEKAALGDRAMEGFNFGNLWYTPITLAAEEVLPFQDVDYGPQGVHYPRNLEDMFNGQHYEAMFGGHTEPFRLRFVETPEKKVKVFICITMYQEPCGGREDLSFEDDDPDAPGRETFDDVADVCGTFPATLKGIFENLEYFNKRSAHPWSEIVVCLVADGRTRINQQENNLKALARMGLYHPVEEIWSKTGPLRQRKRLSDQDYQRFRQVEDAAITKANPKYTVDNGMPVNVHLFENIVHYKDHAPVQMMFCLKEHNGGKIDSHMWFYEVFANYFARLQQEDLYVFNIDSGSRPAKKAILKMVERMDLSEHCAGCCSEIAVAEPLKPKNLFCNWIIPAQAVEYRLGTIIDRPFESLTGTVSVCPGAFNAFRWSALSPPDVPQWDLTRPIAPYFGSLRDQLKAPPLRYANMYLAEDRLLCFEIMCAKDKSQLVKYVDKAPALTDAPDTIAAYLKQRRRWNNGVFFEGMHEIKEGIFNGRIWASGHSTGRKIMMMLAKMLYIEAFVVVNLRLGLFTAMCYIFTYGFVQAKSAGKTGVPPLHVIMGLYFAIMMLFQGIFVGLSLTYKPDDKTKCVQMMYRLCWMAFTFLYVIAMVFLIANLAGQGLVAILVLAVVFSLPLLLELCYGGVRGFVVLAIEYIPYFLMLPLVFIMSPIFSAANIHDVSWGTKGIEMDEEMRKLLQRRITKRNWFLFFFLLANWGIAFLIIMISFWNPDLFTIGGTYTVPLTFLPFVIPILDMLIKIMGSFIYVITSNVHVPVRTFFKNWTTRRDRNKAMRHLSDRNTKVEAGEEVGGQSMTYMEEGMLKQLPKDAHRPVSQFSKVHDMFSTLFGGPAEQSGQIVAKSGSVQGFTPSRHSRSGQVARGPAGARIPPPVNMAL